MQRQTQKNTTRSRAKWTGIRIRQQEKQSLLAVVKMMRKDFRDCLKDAGKTSVSVSLAVSYVLSVAAQSQPVHSQVRTDTIPEQTEQNNEWVALINELRGGK